MKNKVIKNCPCCDDMEHEHVITAEKYKEAWTYHIQELGQLKWNLPFPGDRYRIDKIMEELLATVDNATQELIVSRLKKIEPNKKKKCLECKNKKE